MASGDPGVLPLGMLIIFGDSLTSDSTGVKGAGGECVTEFLCYISSRVTFFAFHVGDHIWST